MLVGVIDQATVSTPAPGVNDLSFDFGFTQPVTIGDFVFKDTNGNGIQDAGELGIAGVTVHLFDPLGNSLATAVTDANGNYTFSSAIGTSTGSAIDNIAGLKANTAGFTIRLDNPADYSTGPLAGLTVSPPLQGGDTTKDSNGTLVGGFDQASVTTPAAGVADLSTDFGFAPTPLPDLQLTKTDDVGGATTLGTPWTWTLHVSNTGTANASFSVGQTVVLDNLPNASINYGTVNFANFTSVTGSGNLTGGIAANDLTVLDHGCGHDRSGRQLRHHLHGNRHGCRHVRQSARRGHGEGGSRQRRRREQ